VVEGTPHLIAGGEEMRGLEIRGAADPAEVQVVRQVSPERGVRRDAPARALGIPGERVEGGLVPVVKAVEDEVLVEGPLVAARSRAIGEARPESTSMWACLVGV
jgi:hypothetical protein